MEKQILNFTVNEQILVCENPIKISTNKVNYIQASFDLGENWDGFDSVRAIWFNDFNCISTVLDSLGNCAVPFEVMKRKGNVKVNLVGSISEDDVLTDRLTSYPVVAVIVDCTAQITGANTSPITPSEFEQFAQRVHTDAERAEAGATASEQSAQNAHTSEQNASQSAQSAHDDKVAIEEAIAEVIQQIEDFEQVQVVVNTLPPSSQATSDFTDGVLTLGIPQGVKGDTGNGIQSIRKTGTSGLVDTYTITFTDGQTTTFTVTNGAKGDTGNGISTIEKTSTIGLVDTYTITYTDETTTTFTVTNGEKGDKGDTGEVSLQELEDATVAQTLSDNEPYNYRRTNNGNGAGHREYDEIVGASVAWNQIFTANGLSGTISGVTLTVTNSGSTVKLSGTATPTLYRDLPPMGKSITGHVYYVDADTTNTNILLYNDNGGVGGGSGNPKRIGKATANNTWYLRLGNGTTFDETIEPQLTDLTLALGSTIADYIYSLEQSTAGSGVTWLKTHFPKLFDNGYMSYDAGSIKSVSGLTAHEMVGVNLWDEEWELGSIYANSGIKYATSDSIRSKNYIEVMPNTTYYFKASDATRHGVFYYDADKQFIGVGVAYTKNVTFTTPDNCHYLLFDMAQSYGEVYKNDICINLSDTSIDGQYFPHESHTYPLDSSVTLRGQYKLNNGQLYAVGDVYKASGEIGKNYAEITFDGSENWRQTSGQSVFYAIKDNMDYAWKSNVYAMTPKYVFCGTRSSGYSNMSDKEFLLYYSGGGAIHEIAFRDNSVADLTAWKTKLQNEPITVLYEVATPTTETATPYTSPQWCDSHGTEEYVGSELPVGHNTQYPMTLIDTADGLSNGTYEPRITVANGKKTVTWVSV